MTPTVAKILQSAVLAVTAAAAFAPDLPGLQPLLPANVYHAAALACAVALWLTQSPLLAPWLPAKSPAQILPQVVAADKS